MANDPMSTSSSHSRRFRDKRPRRGAALVEAAVVMPLVVMFYGLMAFVFSEYEVKQRIVAKSRYEAFRSSLHQCVSDGGPDVGNLDPTLSTLGTLAGFGDVGTFAYVPAVLSGATMQSFVVARGNRTTVTSRGLATNAELSNVVRTRDLTAVSQVYCNPRDIMDTAAASSNVPQLSRRLSISVSDQAMGDFRRYVISILR
jgi:hypothetical protein